MAVFEIDAKNNQMEAILDKAEAIGKEMNLSERKQLTLRLMAEEAVELVNVIIRQYSGSLEILADGRRVTICIRAAKENMSVEEKFRLVDASTSGTNAAYKGFKGTILSLFDNGYRSSQVMSPQQLRSLEKDFIFHSEFTEDGGMYVFNNKADEGVQRVGVVEDVEQSILARLADHIEVGVINQKATITITKQF